MNAKDELKRNFVDFASTSKVTNDFTATTVKTLSYASQFLGNVSSPEMEALWIFASAFITFTTISGFTLLESGFTQRKNEVNTHMKNLLVVVLSGISFWFVGYGFVHGEHDGTNSMTGMGSFLLHSNVERDTLVFGKFFIHFPFAITCTYIVSGAVAERVNLKAFMVYAMFNTAFIYVFPAHWMWSTSGWLHKFGAFDFAGAGVVHVCGGAAAFGGSLLLGPRYGKYGGKKREFKMNKPANVILGAVMLWWSWFGLNLISVVGFNTCTVLYSCTIWGFEGLSGLQQYRNLQMHENCIESQVFEHCFSLYQSVKLSSLFISSFTFLITLKTTHLTFINLIVIIPMTSLHTYILTYVAVQWKYTAGTAVVTIIGAMAGGIASIMISAVNSCRKGYFYMDLGLMVFGILGGLVGTTGVASVCQPWEGLIIGFIGGFVANGVILLLNYYHIDDPVGAVGVHWGAGLWSMISVGLFSDVIPEIGSTVKLIGAFHGGDGYLLGAQLLACLAITTWTAGVSAILFALLHFTIGFRAPLEEEIAGFDALEHGINNEGDEDGKGPSSSAGNFDRPITYERNLFKRVELRNKTEEKKDVM